MNTLNPVLEDAPYPRIIGISGHAGSGKDTIADYLTTTYLDTYVEAFAAPLKRACATAFGIPLGDFSDPVGKELSTANWALSPRMIAQFVGTELFRDSMWKILAGDVNDFWVRRMKYLLLGNIATDEGGIYSPEDTIIIPDVRFQNEYNFIINAGGIVLHVSRAGMEGEVGIAYHKSEVAVKQLVKDTTHSYNILNNGSLEDLYETVEHILTAVKIPLYFTQIVSRQDI